MVYKCKFRLTSLTLILATFNFFFGARGQINTIVHTILVFVRRPDIVDGWLEHNALFGQRQHMQGAWPHVPVGQILGQRKETLGIGFMWNARSDLSECCVVERELALDCGRCVKTDALVLGARIGMSHCQHEIIARIRSPIGRASCC